MAAQQEAQRAAGIAIAITAADVPPGVGRRVFLAPRLSGTRVRNFMLGRRSHERFSVAPPVEGTLRVFQDVLIHRSREGDLVAIAREAGVVGELLALDEAGVGAEDTIVRVVESRPVVMEGAVRHRLRLEPYEVPHS